MSIRIPFNNSGETYFNLTLNESYSATSTGETFFFVFKNEQTDREYTKSLIDESLYSDRYNKFYLKTLKTGGSGQNIAFNTEGWYEYKVYTYADRITRTNVLEIGKCYIYNDATPSKSTYTDTKSKYVYNK